MEGRILARVTAKHTNYWGEEYLKVRISQQLKLPSEPPQTNRRNRSHYLTYVEPLFFVSTVKSNRQFQLLLGSAFLFLLPSAIRIAIQMPSR